MPTAPGTGAGGDVGALGPGQRDRDLDAMAAGTFDVLVVGGGVTGAGTALDAVTRGLTVALVETRDWAAGTSSRSSKLVHGGLRYLEQLRVGLVREALRERGLLLSRLCPHLVRPLPFLYPLTHRTWERAYVGAGVALYDLLAGVTRTRAGLPAHRHLSRRGALALAPGLRPDLVTGGIRYHDAEIDDARHTLEVARTAASYGARVATGARVVGLLHTGGRVRGARVRDLERGREIDVRARTVVNATGVWADDVHALAAPALAAPAPARIQASKGVHLVVPADRVAARTAIITRTSSSVLFVIPWPSLERRRQWLIGTTDTPWDRPKATPAVNRADVAYLLERSNAVLRQPLGERDIVGVYAGLRPLLAGESEATSRLSREHAVVEAPAGLVTVAGGKYTTYRVMAADTVDAVGSSLGRALPPSCTASIPLLGAVGFEAAWNQRERLAAAAGLAPERVERLLWRHGAGAGDVLAAAHGRPELLRPLAGAPDYLAVEAHHAAAREGALHLDDVLARRTRAAIETPDGGVAAAGEVARLMGEVLGWDGAQRAREVQRYHTRVEAERRARHEWSDGAAEASGQ